MTFSFPNNGDNFGLVLDRHPRGYQEQKAIHFFSKRDAEPEQ